jgi:hypothetical protein
LKFLARGDVTTIIAFGDRFVGGQQQPDPVLALGVVFSDWGAAVFSVGHTVTVVSGHARDAVKHLVSAIGSVPAGTLAPMREPREVVLFPNPGQWQETEASRRAQRLRQALRRPIDARGYLTVTVEPEEAMSPPPQHLTWLDFSGDGRYVLTVGNEMALAPATADQLTKYLMKLARIR